MQEIEKSIKLDESKPLISKEECLKQMRLMEEKKIIALK